MKLVGADKTPNMQPKIEFSNNIINDNNLNINENK